MRQSLNASKTVYYNDFVMVRVDKTMLDLFAEKPSSRWDPGYWEPKYDQLLSQIIESYNIVPLRELLTIPIIAPDHVRASKEEHIGKKYSCEYRTLKDLLFTGLNHADINYCSENAFQRLKRSHQRLPW